jgi:CelD/BcsL family acetyltransferase involved in cellulose biosynthesis
MGAKMMYHILHAKQPTELSKDQLDPKAKECRLTLIDSFEEIVAMASSWNNLLTQSGCNSIFLTWDWLYTWSKYFLDSNRKLFILALYRKGKLIGLAPWCIRKIKKRFFSIRQIEFLGTPETGSDYLDILAIRGKEKHVSECIYAYLFGEGHKLWDSMLLQDIPSDSLFMLHFMNKLRNDGKYAQLVEGCFCPISILPPSDDNFFAQLSPNRREQFRRHYRLLQKRGDLNHHTCYLDNGSEEAFHRFLTLYKPRWGRTQDQRFYNHLIEFATRCGPRSGAQLDFLTVEGADVAAVLHFRYDKSLLMYLMAVDKNFDKKISVGNVLIGLCIKKAISNGITVYDFLKGSEEYKFHWANHGRRMLKLNLYQRRVGALAVAFGKMVREAGKIVLR